jgi:hypothetical protein
MPSSFLKSAIYIYKFAELENVILFPYESYRYIKILRVFYTYGFAFCNISIFYCY